MRASNVTPAVAVLAVVAGCVSPPAVAVAPPAAAGPPSASPSPSASSVPQAPAPTPFHVVGASLLQGAKTIDNTTLCPIQGAVFVCGIRRMVRLVGDDLVHEPALEAGLPHANDGHLTAQVDSLLGSWPDDAWLVTGYHQPALHRWSKDRWVQQQSWPETVQITPWRPGRVLVYFYRLYDREVFETYGDGPAPSLPSITHLSKGNMPCPMGLAGGGRRLTVTSDGTIVLRRIHCDDHDLQVVERWAPGASSSTLTDERAPPFPPVTKIIRSGAGQVLKRIDGTEAPVSLPALPDLAPPGSEPLWVQRVWEVGPGDLWALAQFQPPRDGRHTTPGRAILRNVRPTRQIDLGR